VQELLQNDSAEQREETAVKLDLMTVLHEGLSEAFYSALEHPKVKRHGECYGRGYIGRNIHPKTLQPDGLVMCRCAKEVIKESLAAIYAETVTNDLVSYDRDLRETDAELRGKVLAARMLHHGVLYVDF
jgi:hypothetical protein